MFMFFPIFLSLLLLILSSESRQVIRSKKGNDGPGDGDISTTHQEAAEICNGEYNEQPSLAAACGELKKWDAGTSEQRQEMIDAYLHSVTGNDPEWCGSFVNYVMAKSGYQHTDVPLAAAWLDKGTSSPEPVVGAVVIYDWEQETEGIDKDGKHNEAASTQSAHSEHGHAGIVIKVDQLSGDFWVIGGNQKCHGEETKQVCVKKYGSDYSQKRVAGFRIMDKK